MKKIGWVYEFRSILTTTGVEILQKRIAEAKEIKPETVKKLISSFSFRTKKFSSLTVWFMNYVLIINRRPEFVIELKKYYSESILVLKKENKKLVFEKLCGEGLSAIKHLFKEMV